MKEKVNPSEEKVNPSEEKVSPKEKLTIISIIYNKKYKLYFKIFKL
tara:strand:+ start:1354 stop:1491 length:138 start_codon:yes stop_codon:yes gene_type:complete